MILLANDNNARIFMALLPDLLFYFGCALFSFYAIVYLRRMTKFLKIKSDVKLKNIKLLSIIIALFSIVSSALIVQFSVRFAYYKDIDYPVYITKELYIYLLPWFIFYISLITIIVIDIFFINSMSMKRVDEKIITFKEEFTIKQLLIVNESKKMKLEYFDEIHNETITLNFYDKNSKQFIKENIN